MINAYEVPNSNIPKNTDIEYTIEILIPAVAPYTDILPGGVIDIIFDPSYVLNPYCYIERGTDLTFNEFSPGSL